MNNYISQFIINNIQSIATIFTLLLSVFTTWIMIYKPLTFFRGSYLPIHQEQLQKVYSPIFRIIEPYLYQSITIDTAKTIFADIENIICDNYYLVDPKLIYLCDTINKSIVSNEFIMDNNDKYNNPKSTYRSFCSTLLKNLEKNQRCLQIPTRSIYYKVNRRQFSNPYSAFLAFTFIVIRNLLIFFIVVFVVSASLMKLTEHYPALSSIYQ